MTQELRALAASYLTAKGEWSRINDQIMAGTPRAPVPQFSSPQAAADYYFVGRGNPYTGDPLRGALDYYLHPERLQAGLEGGPDEWKKLHIDCDDVAGIYLKMIQHLPGMDARIFTVVDARFTLNNMSHVICAGSWNGQAFGLDTNGYRPLPNVTEATLCQVWNAIYASYGANYVIALETPYPF